MFIIFPAKEAPKPAPAKKEEPKKDAPKKTFEKKAAAAKVVKPPKAKVSQQVKAGAAGKNVLRGKAVQKKKKEHLRFGVDCTNIAEDNIMDVADFVSQFFNCFNSFSYNFFFFHFSGKIFARTLQSSWKNWQLGSQCHL